MPMALGMGTSLVMGSTKGAASFSPLDLSPGLWLRADLGITLNGSKVSAWSDQSGNGRNFTNAVSSSQPTYNSTGGANDQAYIKFTRASETNLAGAHSFLSSLSGFTVFFVLYRPDNSINSLAFSPGADTISQDQGYIDNAYVHSGGGAYGSYAETSTTWIVKSTTYDGTQTGNANRLKAHRNYVQKTLSFTGTVPATTGSETTMYIGGYYTGGSGFHFDGGLSEIIIYPYAFSDSQRQQVEAYLSTRYAI